MMARPIGRRARLDRALNGILLVIALQFFAGMWLNLFGSFPTANATFLGTLTDGSDPVLILHVVLGILLFLGAIAIVALAWRDPVRSMRGFALGGLAGIVLAGFAGQGFVYSGFANNGASFGMAIGFAIALTSYYEGLVRLRGDRTATRTTPDAAAAAA